MRVAVHLAEHGRATLETLADEESIPRPFTPKVVAKLVAAGLVSTTKGRSGGVALTRPPEQISLLEVIEAVDGPIELNRCVLAPTECDRASFCTVHPVWVSVQAELRRMLGRHMLDELVPRITAS